MSGRRPALLLGVAAAAYLIAAWLVAPGFYDGIAPQQPYNWVSPPAQFRSGNKAAEAGGTTVRPGQNGIVDPGTAFTGDGQASLSFIPGSFEPPSGGGAVTVEIRPATSFPDPGSIHFGTNVYLITASQPLSREALVTLSYSDQLPAPSDVYFAPERTGVWAKLGSTGQAAPFHISARTKFLGYFAAGYPSGATRAPAGPRIGGGQTLPIITAAAILIVVLAGVPLALLRRRQGGSDDSEADDEAAASDPGPDRER